MLICKSGSLVARDLPMPRFFWRILFQHVSAHHQDNSKFIQIPWIGRWGSYICTAGRFQSATASGPTSLRQAGGNARAHSSTEFRLRQMAKQKRRGRVPLLCAHQLSATQLLSFWWLNSELGTEPRHFNVCIIKIPSIRWVWTYCTSWIFNNLVSKQDVFRDPRLSPQTNCHRLLPRHTMYNSSTPLGWRLIIHTSASHNPELLRRNKSLGWFMGHFTENQHFYHQICFLPKFSMIEPSLTTNQKTREPGNPLE